MDQTTQLVGLVCEHQQLAVTVLGIVGAGSVVSWFQNHLPAPIKRLAQIANIADWDEIVKAIIAALSKKGN